VQYGGDQKVLQFDTLSKKVNLFIVGGTNTVLRYVMYTDKMIASFVVMTIVGRLSVHL